MYITKCLKVIIMRSEKKLIFPSDSNLPLYEINNFQHAYTNLYVLRILYFVVLYFSVLKIINIAIYIIPSFVTYTLHICKCAYCMYGGFVSNAIIVLV